MSRQKLVHVTLSDEEHSLVSKAAQSGEGTRLSTVARTLLLAWAKRVFGVPGSYQGGPCGAPGCLNSGAEFWHYGKATYWCASCAVGEQACVRRKAVLEEISERELVETSASTESGKRGRPRRSRHDKFALEIERALAAYRLSDSPTEATTPSLSSASQPPVSVANTDGQEHSNGTQGGLPGWLADKLGKP